MSKFNYSGISPAYDVLVKAKKDLIENFALSLTNEEVISYIVILEGDWDVKPGKRFSQKDHYVAAGITALGRGAKVVARGRYPIAKTKGGREVLPQVITPSHS